MKRTKFEKIVEKEIYYLDTPFGEGGSGIVLVRGEDAESTVLIDTGASDAAITEYLIPALRAEDISPRDIGAVTVTHCHINNIGGLHALRRECPQIKVVVPRGFSESIRNPMVDVFRERELFPLHNPPFQEIRGVFTNRELTEEEDSGEKEFCGLRAIRVGGHASSVCWFHSKTGVLISGDALQGNGNAFQGMPYYTDVKAYRESLRMLKKLSVNYLLTGHAMDGVSNIERGHTDYIKAITRCEECVSYLGTDIKLLLDKGVTDIETIAKTIALDNFEVVPEALTYAMQTVEAHIREGVFK